MFLEQETLDLFVHKVDVYSQRLVTVHHSRNVVLVWWGKLANGGI